MRRFKILFKLFLLSIKEKIFPKYTVGFFTINLPSNVINELVQLLKYCYAEEIEGVDFFKLYTKLILKFADKESFLESSFIKYYEYPETIAAFETFYWSLLEHEHMNNFLPSSMQSNRPTYPEQNRVFICTAFASQNFKVKKIKSLKDFSNFVSNIQERKPYDNSIFIHAIKFQGSSPIETSLINQKITDLRL